MGPPLVAAVENGTFTVELNGVPVDFTKEDLLISVVNKEGYATEADNGMTVILDTAITEELMLEGISRELVSKIQTMRKEANYEVTDHIAIGYDANGNSAKVLADGSDIQSDVLADSLVKGVFDDGYTKTWDINGEEVVISIKRI